MSKAVLISIRPKWVEKIANGEKTIEVRKTKPNLPTPFKCYIYCTQGNDARRLRGSWGKVIGEFVCDCVTPLYNVCMDNWERLAGGLHNIEKELVNQACLTEAKLHTYAGGKNCFAWHISDLRIYEQPRKLEEFRRLCPNDLYCESCAMYSNNGGICNNGALPLRRPPQSWCYVEAMKNG